MAPYHQVDDMGYIDGDRERIHSIAMITIDSKQRPNGLFGTKISIYPGKDIFIGRDQDLCSPSFQSSIISKVHFRIYSVIYDEDDISEFPPLIYCEDRQSSNGTYVNNTLIGTLKSPRSPYLLNDGDMISIRPHWKFHFRQNSRSAKKSLDHVQMHEIEVLFNDRFIITDRLLGRGIYGTVYLANDVMTQKQLACKIVDLRRRAKEPNEPGHVSNVENGLNVQAYAEQVREVSGVRKKLIREIEFLSRLSHPNIVTLHKAFRSPYSLYIFNELAAGGDLFSFLQANGYCLEDLHARIISRQVAIAVQYLHSQGIAHRDLKPENILVMRTGIGHRVVLTDFGCAGHIRPKRGRMMTTVGTFDYVAPEVHTSDRSGYTEAIDMWSLGIITLCLLTGETLMPFSQLQKTSQAHIAAILVQAGETHPQWRDVNVHGKDFVNKLLILDPNRRMGSRDAIGHAWFCKPTRVATALDKLYERANKFWANNPRCTNIIEELSNVAEQRPSSGSNRLPRSSKKLPDTTASPYFGLDRHLQPQDAPSRSTMDLKRKRVLEKLKQSDSQFINTSAQSEVNGPAADTSARKPPCVHETLTIREASHNTPPIPRPPEPSFFDSASIATPRIRPVNATNTQERTGTPRLDRMRQTNADQEMSGISSWEGPEGRGVRSENNISDDCYSRSTTPRRGGARIKDVDANDIFDTIPIEIKAAQAAEAARGQLQQGFSFINADDIDIDVDDETQEKPTKMLARSYTLTQDDRELHDEAAKELPRLSTAKEFSRAIARRKDELRDSLEER